MRTFPDKKTIASYVTLHGDVFIFNLASRRVCIVAMDVYMCVRAGRLFCCTS